jgi:hypothetical protein
MVIRNDSDTKVSWFGYNQMDATRMIALDSGDLDSGGSHTWDPPDNQNGLYFVMFTYVGGGGAYAGAALPKNLKVSLKHEGRYWSAVVQ